MHEGPLHRELARARAHTDALFGLIADATLYDRPIPDRHRLVFYLGHLDKFDWNQVARGALGARSFQPDFDRLFEAGIDPPPGKAPQDTKADWPCVSEVRAYIQRARQGLDRLWGAAPTERRWVAIEHRWMHAETLCYLLHQLPYSSKRRPALRTEPAAPAPEQDEIDIPAGRTTLGQRSDSFGNGWEWTSTTFAGFDGFAAHDYYSGYSANFFDGEHWVLKGALPRTARCLLRRSFRNWFRGDYPYAYTAFRVVRN